MLSEAVLVLVLGYRDAFGQANSGAQRRILLVAEAPGRNKNLVSRSSNTCDFEHEHEHEQAGPPSVRQRSR